MNVKRMFAIIAIYLLACGGWGILGTTTALRSSQFADLMGREVRDLWGTPLVQRAPRVSVKVPGSESVRFLMPSANDLDVDVQLDYRRKGLVWYPTYRVDFRPGSNWGNSLSGRWR